MEAEARASHITETNRRGCSVVLIAGKSFSMIKRSTRVECTKLFYISVHSLTLFIREGGDCLCLGVMLLTLFCGSHGRKLGENDCYLHVVELPLVNFIGSCLLYAVTYITLRHC